MNFKILVLTPIITFWLLTSCTIVQANPLTSDEKSSYSKETPDQLKKDSEIIKILIVLNKNEIAAANEASKKKVSPAVANYAKFLNQEHTKNLKETLTLSDKDHLKPIDSKTSNTLADDGKKELNNLSGKNAKDFEVVYINAMVQDHKAALDKLDNQLLKNATNPQLKTHLTATREHIAHHLKEAQDIQKDLPINQ